MERKRARQILDSPDIINVAYQNIPVWIDDLGNEDQATIRDLNSDIKMEVPLRELNEIGDNNGKTIL